MKSLPALTFLAASTLSLGAHAQNLNQQLQLDIQLPSILKNQELGAAVNPATAKGPLGRVSVGTGVCDTPPPKARPAASPTHRQLAVHIVNKVHNGEDVPAIEDLKKSDPGLAAILTPPPGVSIMANKGAVVDRVELHFRTYDALFNNAKFRFWSVIPPIAPNLCATKQPTSVRFSGPIKPSYETNVLKSPSNIHEDRSIGLGASMLVTMGGFRDFDIMAVSLGAASTRYDKFGVRDGDGISTQGVYQFFLGSYGYKNGATFFMDERTPKTALLPAGMITVDTFAIAFQNSTSYTPTFNTRTSNLFTPQVQLSRSNISLLGADPRNECSTSDGAYKRHVFCYSADVYVNAGKTSADIKTLDNMNFEAGLSLGKRIDQTDWKISLQASLTEKIFDNVAGGRQDMTLQSGASLSYSHPAVKTPIGSTALGLSLPITYFNNNSNIAAAEWHGWIVMPTVTLSFTPG